MIKRLLFVLAIVLGTVGVTWGQSAETVGTLEALKAAIAKEGVTTITLSADIANADAASGSAITIRRALTLNGNAYKMIGSADQNIIAIAADGVKVNDIFVTNTKKKAIPTDLGGSGICVHGAKGVTLSNIRTNYCTGAGVVINGSTVSIDGIYAVDNLWGGVALGQEAGQDAPKLTIKNVENVTGPLQIYADATNANGWVDITGSKDEPAWTCGQIIGKTVWTNKINIVDGMRFYTNARSIQEINTVLSISSLVGIRGVKCSDIAIVGVDVEGDAILITADDIIFDGNGTFLTGRATENMIHVKTAKGVILRNIRGTNRSGNMVMLEDAQDVKIESCEFTESAGAGLLVSNSSANASNLKTNINGKGGVILSKLSAERQFTMTSGLLFEKEAVWTDDSKDFVTLPAEYKATTSGSKTVWTNAAPAFYFTPEGAGNKTGESWDNAYSKSSLGTIISSSPDNAVMKLGAGTYDYMSAPIKIEKTTTIEGAGVDKTIIKGAIAIKGSTTATAANVAIKGIKFDYSPKALTTGRCQSVFQLVDGKTNLVVENSVIDNRTAGYANGFGTTSYLKMQNVFQLDSAATGTLLIANTTINLLADNQRAISAHGQLSSISMNNSAIKGQDNGSGQYGACIHRNSTMLTLDNSAISLNNHYCIWVIQGEDQTIHIKNKSIVSGYGALYLMNPSGVRAVVSGGSTLTGITKNNGPSDSFGAIIFEGASNSTVEIVDSYIGNEFKAPQTAAMTPIMISNNTSNYPKSEGNRVVLSGKSIVRTFNNSTNPFMVAYGISPDPKVDNNYVTVVGAEVQFKDQNDKDCFVVNHQDGAFRNAAVSVVDAIVYGSIYKEAYNQWPIANTGDMVMATDQTTAQVLASLNAAKAQFFERPEGLKEDTDTEKYWERYIVPSNVIVNSKDAYLVSGKDAVNAFAEKATDGKAVYWLQQGETAFVAKALSKNVVIATNTTWSDAKNGGSSVLIKNGATLTIQAAMALDSVLMEGSAQLRTDLNVTANALQYAYPATKSWKAFGFPTAAIEVKGVDAPSANDDAKGVWMGVLGTSATAPVFELQTNAFASAGLIAADKDSNLVVLSANATPLSLTTKAEPSAPDATTKFLFVANPNLSAMQLTQTAYVLDAAGKFFERVDNPTIAPFQSYILADAGTTATLRSLRVDDGITTGNDIVPTDGYYIQAAEGAILIRTNEPVQILVADMNGRLLYNGLVTTDGQRIDLPAGIYAVNRQLVRVK